MDSPLALPAVDPAHGQDRLRRFALRGARTAAFALVMATLLWLVLPQSFVSSVVFSLSIALSCWLLIDGARIGAALWLHRGAPGGARAQSLWPGWRWMVPIAICGGILGYAAGNEIANALLGENAPGPFNAEGHRVVGVLILAIVPAVVITHFFHSREMIAINEARAQRAERQAAEQQLKLLESQLEPHMLFNTLANLRVLIALEPARAQAMLDQLIAFLRASLSGSRLRMHPLSAEFDRLRDYVALMQVRLGDRLATRFDLPADLAGVPVPPLLLQPLVENSVRHGIEPKLGGGRIEVSAARDGSTLVLRVRDSGLGLNGLPADASSFGLTQVRERLATLYGTAGSLTLADADDGIGGAVAVVRLPLARPEAADRACAGAAP